MHYSLADGEGRRPRHGEFGPRGAESGCRARARQHGSGPKRSRRFGGQRSRCRAHQLELARPRGHKLRRSAPQRKRSVQLGRYEHPAGAQHPLGRDRHDRHGLPAKPRLLRCRIRPAPAPGPAPAACARAGGPRQCLLDPRQQRLLGPLVLPSRGCPACEREPLRIPRRPAGMEGGSPDDQRLPAKDPGAGQRQRPCTAA